MRRNFADAIAELQKLPMASAKVISGVELASGVDTLVPHGLGRAPIMHWPSSVRAAGGVPSAGVIEEYRDGVDRTRYIKLRASGYGATITVDLVVM